MHEKTDNKLGISLPVLIVILIAVCMRFFHLHHESYWIDEHFSRMFVSYSSREYWESVIRYLFPTFFFPFIRLCNWLFGYHEWFGRFAAAFFGSAGVLSAYLFFLKVEGRKHAFLTLIFLSLSIEHLFFSREYKPYSFALFWIALNSFLYLTAIEKPSLKTFTAYWATALIAIYGQPVMGFLVFATQAIHYGIFLALCPHRRPRKSVLAVMAVLALLYLAPLFLVILLHHAPKMWIQSHMDFVRPLSVFYISDFFIEVSGGVIFALFLAPFLFVGIANYLRRACDRSNEQSQLSAAYALLLFFAPPILLFFLSLSIPIFAPRYCMVSMLAYLLIVVQGIRALPATCRVLVLLTFFLISGEALLHYYTFSTKQRVAEATKYIEDNSLPVDALYVYPSYHKGLVVNYYLPAVAGITQGIKRPADRADFDFQLEGIVRSAPKHVAIIALIDHDEITVFGDEPYPELLKEAFEKAGYNIIRSQTLLSNHFLTREVYQGARVWEMEKKDL